MAFTLTIGAQAPDFALPGVDGRTWSLADFKQSPVLVVVFSCNHCPSVVGSEDRMIAFEKAFRPRGVALVAINANETENHPADDFPHMVERAKEKGFRFPYLRDEGQDVARAYGALKTPHFFVFGSSRRLLYTGRMDDNPREPGKETTHELRDAVEAVLAGRPVAVPLTNPKGCNVKWRGKPEHWMPPDACDIA